MCSCGVFQGFLDTVLAVDLVGTDDQLAVSAQRDSSKKHSPWSSRCPREKAGGGTVLSLWISVPREEAGQGGTGTGLWLWILHAPRGLAAHDETVVGATLRPQQVGRVRSTQPCATRPTDQREPRQPAAEGSGGEEAHGGRSCRRCAPNCLMRRFPALARSGTVDAR